jgi:hypothetical protein
VNLHGWVSKRGIRKVIEEGRQVSSREEEEKEDESVGVVGFCKLGINFAHPRNGAE